MKLTKVIAKLLLAPLLLLALVSGCATPALWSDQKMNAQNQPASAPNLRLFSTSGRNDLLVVYDEYSGHAHASNTRAYWLEQNEKRIAHNHRPLFVSQKLANHMMPVPVFSSESAASTAPPPIYAIMSEEGGSFVVHHGEKTTACHLPDYDDGRGLAEKIFLTPPAVTFDAAIICGYAAALYYGNK